MGFVELSMSSSKKKNFGPSNLPLLVFWCLEGYCKLKIISNLDFFFFGGEF